MAESYELKSYDFPGDPFEIFSLFKDEPFVFFLDSSLTANPSGRYSFIGFDPFDIFRDKGRNSLCDLRGRFKKYFPLPYEKKKDIALPFWSGMVGYFGYDFGLQLEKFKLSAQDDLLIPDCFFGFYDCAIVIDRFLNKLYIFSTGLPEKNDYLKEKKAKYRLEKIIKKLAQYSPVNGSLLKGNSYSFDSENIDFNLSCNFTKEAYIRAIKKALKYIKEGDIYQVNLAQRFLFDAHRYDLHIDPVDLYCHLRKLSPSSFSSYLDGGDFKILSSSPERFLHLKGRHAETRPMKGTRPRGSDGNEDGHLRRELLDSKKDKAELLMITDLERNDLGRVCRYGSVKVDRMRTLEEYKTVFQTTSTIKGTLREDKDCFDLIEACFPSGSVTGCPKIRAMEIIEELEPTRRALYTGSLGYISSSLQMDFNILIRTLFVKEDKVFFHVGSGVVADSTPENEYNETLIKARALRQSLSAMLPLKAEVSYE